MKKLMIIFTMVCGMFFATGCSVIQKIPEGMSKNTYENGVKCLDIMNSYLDGSKSFETITISIENPAYKIHDEIDWSDLGNVDHSTYQYKLWDCIDNFMWSASAYNKDNEANKDSKDRCIGFRDQLKDYLGK